MIPKSRCRLVGCRCFIKTVFVPSDTARWVGIHGSWLETPIDNIVLN
jgi:hypothetical protein